MFTQLQIDSAYSGANAAFIEALYEEYLRDPESVPEDWRSRFARLNRREEVDTPHAPVRETFRKLARERANTSSAQHCLSPLAAEQQTAVLRLINGYRVRGHQNANLDPLKLRPQPAVPDLDPAFLQLDRLDPATHFNTGSLAAPDRMPLKQIIELVRRVYCSTIGAEYMHITNTHEKRWIQERIEGRPRIEGASVDEKRWLLTLLTAAEGIEKHLHSRYVGQKRFSLEGGESLIPLLDELIQHAGRNGVEETVIGMAHRGRINVLTNILGKP
ncbi:2-oxoglutarate dehydrogenase, partial [Candidatus Endoriftia persephone str. Guaymas]|nr:2-oxoglutarate dehydrogenase [Candidatus Endoriftia persephone str. Guaymas]